MCISAIIAGIQIAALEALIPETTRWKITIPSTLAHRDSHYATPILQPWRAGNTFLPTFIIFRFMRILLWPWSLQEFHKSVKEQILFGWNRRFTIQDSGDGDSIEEKSDSNSGSLMEAETPSDFEPYVHFAFDAGKA